MTTSTPVFGIFSPIVMILTVCWYSAAFKYILASSPQEYRSLTREKGRENLSNNDASKILEILKGNTSISKDGMDVSYADARAFFDLFAQPVTPSGARVLLEKDIEAVIGTGKLPDEVVAKFGNGVSYDIFMTVFLSVDAVQRHCRAAVASHTHMAERDKAKYVFDMILGRDKHNRSTFGKDELSLLLLEWNVETHESGVYFDKVSKNVEDQIEFEEFYLGMSDVWRFVIDEAINDIAKKYCPCIDHAGNATLQKIKAT
jgi:hypothetical protein